jgi:muramoyltetrapeptide carboxypeptidase
MPELEGALLLLEVDEEESAVDFDRHLQSLIHQPGFAGVRGLVIGRFQRASEVDLDTLKAIIESKRELDGLPVVANASFGHTTPQFTFPIGGYGRLLARNGRTDFSIDEH